MNAQQIDNPIGPRNVGWLLEPVDSRGRSTGEA